MSQTRWGTTTIKLQFTYLIGCAGARFLKTLFEIIREKCIEDGIHGGVGVAQAASQQKYHHHRPRMVGIMVHKN